jgi:HEAT repeat protein
MPGSSKAKSVGSKLAALNALRDHVHSTEAVELLRQSLSDQSNHVIGRAADIIGETDDQDYVKDLLAAYQSLIANPLKTDPGCVGKTAIVRSLIKLNHDDAEFYRQGIEYKQPEPVWQGSKETAGELRGLCAAGLVQSASSLEVLNRCAVLLADNCAEARMGAARAIAALRQPEGAPLIRLKLLTGDANAEVIGECCAALLRLDRDEGVRTVVQLLWSDDADTCVQAALALGESRLSGTFEPLRNAWERQREPAVRESLLICIGLLRSSEAGEFLFSLITSNQLGGAGDAIKALKPFGNVADLRQRIEAAVNATGNARLSRVFEKEWGESR